MRGDMRECERGQGECERGQGECERGQGGQEGV